MGLNCYVNADGIGTCLGHRARKIGVPGFELAAPRPLSAKCRQLDSGSNGAHATMFTQ